MNHQPTPSLLSADQSTPVDDLSRFPLPLEEQLTYELHLLTEAVVATYLPWGFESHLAAGREAVSHQDELMTALSN